jgi:Flp pilus assembly pilin Flp
MDYLLRFQIRLRERKGQAMTEYAMILGAVAVVVYVVLKDGLADELGEFVVKVTDLLTG